MCRGGRCDGWGGRIFWDIWGRTSGLGSVNRGAWWQCRGTFFLSFWSSLGVRELERKRAEKGGSYRVLLAGMIKIPQTFQNRSKMEFMGRHSRALLTLGVDRLESNWFSCSPCLQKSRLGSV